MRKALLVKQMSALALSVLLLGIAFGSLATNQRAIAQDAATATPAATQEAPVTDNLFQYDTKASLDVKQIGTENRVRPPSRISPLLASKTRSRRTS